MTNEHSPKSPEPPTNLDGFIDGIDRHDEKNKQHLKDIVAMVGEGALEKWKAKYLWHIVWHANKGASEQTENGRLPEELRSDEVKKRDYPDEYYWLESAVILGLEEGYLSEKDEACTRLLLTRAMKG
ncbi:MAG: hypothetical protein A3D65_02255 [Candidatus Lloydbacteria bacterium RIFCSPHIGHO2_02_FULL_50_13]|uniref:Uncharacterized protein n=1 Tax=Candidatus Lloydbacteria bacterium RIFCSPHIGHO2_02_FULL_50_13 TaxID=1798661 RepID=A0A1G2D0J4_9BACT|nr:MAG: hypothetical protein A3D65_02255 [Candidatus Lloydbacteria bacterium RIFCSPHIGHO2_02_FULL_50_13]